MINLKKIICWAPLLSGVGAAVTIGILAYMTYQTELGFWLLASFGATTVIVFGYHDNQFAQPKNVFFGHLLSAFVGILFATFFGVSFITIGLAVGIGVMLMMAFKITHPPAGGNPIIVMIGGVSFQFLIFPVMVGAIAIIIGGIIYNRLILKKKYPQTWK
jgi:CBS-domain-containing membrane protein